jgi:hypothetical protein
MSVTARRAALVAGAILVVLAAAAADPIPQPPDYHAFADQRRIVNVPNGLDVLSNLPFAFAGMAGLVAVARRRTRGLGALDDAWDRWPYAALFLGVALTSAGSAYYHLAPDNARLVWDRLPMTLGFTGLLTALLAERVSRPAARRLFVPLTLAGLFSVVYWHWTELRLAGDLRPYLAVQFGSLLLVVLVLALFPKAGRGTGALLAGLGLYAAAKGLELWDAEVYAALGGAVSGHTLKHLAAASGAACVVAGLAALRSDARSYSREVGHRFGLGFEHLEHGQQAAERQQILDSLRQVEQHDSPTLPGHHRTGGGQFANPRAGDVRDARQVEDDQLSRLEEQTADFLLQAPVGVGSVEPATDVNDGHGTGTPLQEFHDALLIRTTRRASGSYSLRSRSGTSG